VPLVSNHLLKLLKYLETQPPQPTHVIVDNAGFELLTDFALAETLIANAVATTATFHLKSQPNLRLRRD